ncbi:hypothetical protein N9L02_01255 [Gammaproteobacteria bacterium]|nr:hypothetical protein [Gammaproteobacteria bacterium]
MFRKNENQLSEIKKKYADLIGDIEGIKSELASIEHNIKSSQTGGCIKIPTIMGPNPELEQHYLQHKEILENMLNEAKSNSNNTNLKL